MTAANNPPNFTPEKYTTIASNHLVVYSIHTLYKDGDEISAEDIISACFKLFPKKFSLRTYPQWPDSALVGRRLHDCEKSGWLTARIETGFKLTAKGTRLAERVARELGVAIPRKEKPKQVHKLQVDKLQVAETAKPAPVTPKPEEEAKTPVVEAPKAVEKVVASVVKIAPVRPKPAEKKVVAPAVKPAPKAKTTVHRPPSNVKVEKRVNLQVDGVVKPSPVKPKSAKKTKAPVVETPKPVEKKAVAPVAKPVAAKPKPAKKAKTLAVKAPKPVEKKATAPVAKPVTVKPKSEEKAKAPATKAQKPVEKKVATAATKPAAVKQKPAKKIKLRIVKAPKPVEKKAVAPVAKVAPVKPKPAEKAKTPVVKAPKPVEKKAAAKVAKPAPVKPKAEKAKVVETPKAKVVPPPVAPRQLSLLPTVSAEEKARAGKFIKMMEASDAYRMYKKNGANANIGEFDFRSLLLCTMESSHETLARNVELFKGYAGIHNRQDLTTFLGLCADKFAHLLTPEKKAVRKLK